jgi:phage replication-related protein YjqB (UPF0714/DUF867 family)
MPDKYSNYQELARYEQKGIDFIIRQAAGKTMSTLVLGLHAGRIEPGISEIVLAVAGADLSYYLFEGIKAQGNKDLHITSTHFDEPGCLALIQISENVVAIHGERSDDKVVYLGGLDEQLKGHLMTALREHDFMAKQHAKPLLQGTSPKNICNRGKSGAGVQLELSNGLRRSFFQALNTDGKRRPTVHFHRFIAALRNGLRNAGVF